MTATDPTAVSLKYVTEDLIENFLVQPEDAEQIATLIVGLVIYNDEVLEDLPHNKRVRATRKLKLTRSFLERATRQMQEMLK